MSIISEQDFLSQLYVMQSQNPPCAVQLYNAKTIYDIDLSTRKVNAPEFISVNKDHNAETIYFRVPRFHDYMDLFNTVCVVQYNTPGSQTFFDVIPFYDVITERENNMMLFPWCVDGSATQLSGTVTFSFRFFIVEPEIVTVTDYVDTADMTSDPVETRYKLMYSLETLPRSVKILKGLEWSSDIEKPFDIPATNLERVLQEIDKIKREGVYWTIYE